MLQPMVEEYIKRVTATGLNGRKIVDDVVTIKEHLEQAPAGSH